MMNPNDLDLRYALRRVEREREWRQWQLLQQAQRPVRRGTRTRLAVSLIALACWLAPGLREQVIVRPA